MNYAHPLTSPSSTTYLLPDRSEEELVQQMNLAGVMTELLGGPFPEYPDLAGVETILDLGCGPGSWILDVSRYYSDLLLIGVDNEPSMISYARMRAQAQKRSERVRFAHLDVKQFPWPLEDSSFDLINGRFMQSFLRTEHWPRVLQECQRVLRPGGRIRLTEEESTITNSPAYAHLYALLPKVLQQEGHSFDSGHHTNGITHMLSYFLIQAGFQDIEHTPLVIDYSVTSMDHYSISDVMLQAFAPSLLGKKIIQLGLLSEADYQDLYAKAQGEVHSALDFCACTYFLTVSGQKRGIID